MNKYFSLQTNFTRRMLEDFEFKKDKKFIEFDKGICNYLDTLLETRHIKTDEIGQIFVKIFKFGVEEYGLGADDCDELLLQCLIAKQHDEAFLYICSIFHDRFKELLFDNNFSLFMWTSIGSLTPMKYVLEHFKYDIPDRVFERLLYNIDYSNNYKVFAYLLEHHRFTVKAINKAIQGLYKKKRHLKSIPENMRYDLYKKEKLLEKYLNESIKYTLLEFFQTKIQQMKHKLLIQVLEHKFWAYPKGIRYRELLFKNKN